MTSPPNLVVIRAARNLPQGFLPPDLDGKWFDVNDLLPGRQLSSAARRIPWGDAVAVPTGRFEVREHDGAVAEVFEVRP